MRFKHIAALSLALLLLLSSAGCGKKEAPAPTPAVGGEAALTIKNTAYSAAQVNYEYMAVYQQFSQYAMYYGSMLPDDPYEIDDEYETWGDFYLAQTEEKLKQLTSLCEMAAEAGVELDDTEKQQVEDWIDSMKENATVLGKEDFNAFVEENFGAGVTEDVLRDMAQRETLAMKYVQYYEDHLTFSQEEIDAAYEADKDSYDTYSFSYCMVTATQDPSVAPDDNSMAAAKAKAEEILAKAQAGSATGAALLEAAAGGDPDVAVDTIQMDGSTITQYQIPFESWIKDASRAAGDLTIAEQTGYGYFVVLFEGRERSDTPTVNVRHILIQAEDADADGTISDAEMEAAKTAIEQVKAEYEAGEQTEDAFAALANQYSTDPGSNTNGGLYENVYEGQMVPEFNDFCFAENRKPGDVEIVSDEMYSGYHLMYFVGSGDPYTTLLIRQALTDKAIDAFAESLTKDVEIVKGAAYEKIGLSEAFLETLNADYGVQYPEESPADEAEPAESAQP